MNRISYVNGRYLPHAYALVHIEDRGYQFSDAVYEGFEIHQCELVDFDKHIARLKRSMGELRMSAPHFMPALKIIFRELIRKNKVIDGFAYLQISRGVAPRNHAFPPSSTPSSLVMTVRSINRENVRKIMEEGIKVISFEDMRWSRVDIKTVSLLPNVLARQAAAEQGAGEAWLIDKDEFITEGSASNAWIANDKGQIITRSIDGNILAGITRDVVMNTAATLGFEIVEAKFTLKEAYDAKEAFNTGASSLVTPVVQINDTPVGDGSVGPLVRALQAAFRDHTNQ